MNHLESSLRASMLSIVVLCMNATALAAHEGWGIVVDRFDRVYVADIPASTVWRISPDGRIEAVLRDVHSHALTLGADGSVYGTDVEVSGSSRDVWRLDMSGRRSNLMVPGSEALLDLQPFLVGNDGAVYSVTRYQPQLPVERRSLYLLRRDRSGKVNTLAGGNVGYADGRGHAARFTGIDGMAWLPDGRIAFVDGARVRAVSPDGHVGSLSGELTRPQWDQDLMGLSVTADGAVLVGDFAERRVIRLHEGKATTIFSSGMLWSPTAATETKNGIYVLEHLRAPLGILGDLKIGPYLQVRLIGTDGRSRVISRRWGANSTAVFSIMGAIALLLIVLVVGRSRARSRRQNVSTFVKSMLMTVLLVTGCKSTLDPRLSGDIYVLESISGIPLPAPYAQNPEFNGRIIADTIAFTSETTGERRSRLEVSAAGETRLERSKFTYTNDGGRVAISYPCSSNASCIAPPHLIGTLTSASFVVTTSKISRQPLAFRRLFPPD